MNNRLDRLNSEFRKYISEILSNKVKDPRITEMFTIMRVDCDRELAHAKVDVSIYSTDEARGAKTFMAIVDSAPYVRQQISKIMHIRTIPQFHFVLDTSMEYSQKISEMINEINKDRYN